MNAPTFPVKLGKPTCFSAARKDIFGDNFWCENLQAKLFAATTSDGKMSLIFADVQISSFGKQNQK
jgi:hypothetical protein